MQTHLAEWIRGTPEGDAAEAILRKCVHCGFCNATCPTYQLRGDELDGPRGRIYLIKQMLEGEPVSANTQLHLDRCLTCRACETTCPSGVQYGRLADIGRDVVARKLSRSRFDVLQRRALSMVLPRRWLFAPLLAAGRLFRSLMPAKLAAKVPAGMPAAGAWPAMDAGAPRRRRMLVLAGCVQPTLSPDINAAAARVLDRLGIELSEVPRAGCCGALRFHLDFQADGLDDMRRMIDAWWPAVERGEVEAIVMTASGCGVTVKEYGHHLAGDAAYRDKAARISAMTRDLSEVLHAERKALADLLRAGSPAAPPDAGAARPVARIAFHPPCTLQHGQQLRGLAEDILERAGFELAPVPDAHLCCGSAGTYSLLQPELSAQLQSNKLAALQSGGAQMILTANIGCQSHLAAAARLPVRHWVVALDERLAGGRA
ncbi:MAG: glycolate oxidase subunit GlcF [Betaproteobacteria bacterium]|nr:glycolate oxidase subunit GlcF [Betaproteobacteria bacterium]